MTSNMRTRNEEQYEKNRRHILDTARDLMVKHGPDEVSLRMVARESGYSPASLYEYFENRDAILAELASRAMDLLGRELRSVNEADPLKQLIMLGRAYLRFATENPRDFLLVFSRLPSRRRSFDSPVPARSPYAPVLEAVKRFGDTGGFNPEGDLNTETAALGLWGLVHGLAMLRLEHLRDFEADFTPAVEGIIRAYLQGLR